jgi:hypothetical protein
MLHYILYYDMKAIQNNYKCLNLLILTLVFLIEFIQLNHQVFTILSIQFG